MRTISTVHLRTARSTVLDCRKAIVRLNTDIWDCLFSHMEHHLSQSSFQKRTICSPTDVGVAKLGKVRGSPKPRLPICSPRHFITLQNPLPLYSLVQYNPNTCTVMTGRLGNDLHANSTQSLHDGRAQAGE
jgi:hypothetical protein